MSLLIKRKIHKTHDLIKQTSEILDLPYEDVQEVINYQFRYLTNFANHPHRAEIHLPSLGRFTIFPKAMDKFRLIIRLNKFKKYKRAKYLSQLLRVYAIRHKVIQLNKKRFKNRWEKQKNYLSPKEL
jgi:hypothetical protein